MNKNFLLVSLEEKKARKIAEVINNDTSRKIIDHLAKKDATESDLSKELGLAISTVHYNLKQLQQAGLVVVEEFHYSQKGKEVNHYALANKYIIIAPKTENPSFLEALKKIMPITIIAAIVAVIMQLFNFVSINKMAEAPTLSQYAAKEAVADSAQTLMASAPATTTVVSSNPAAYFLIGALAVIIIYFIYEFTRKN